MTLFSSLFFAAAILSLLLAVGSLLSRKVTFATGCFAAGMALLGIDSLLSGQVIGTTEAADVIHGLTLKLIVSSFLPAAWLGFSLTYSRGDARASLNQWRVPLAIVTLLPIGLAIGFQRQLIDVLYGEQLLLRFGWAAKALNLILLVSNVWILMNLEQTFRGAVGGVRWRIKFVVIGLAVIIGSRLYVRSQALLFATYDAGWVGIESSGLLIGCVFLIMAYLRDGLATIDVYPSRAVLGSSVTVLLTGGYLLIVGVLARMVKQLGGSQSLQFQIFVVLLGMALLAVLLLSDRLRQRIHGFVDRHFARAQHDSVKIWTGFSRRLANVKDQTGLSEVAVKLVSETFEVLSVTIWLLDGQTEQLIASASTSPRTAGHPGDGPHASTAVAAGLRAKSSTFDLEDLHEPWAEELRQLNPSTFPNGGNRWCVPLRAGEQSLGALVLADRVNGANYSAEQLQLLNCIADQLTSVLLNLRLSDEVARSRELTAFQTMSAFFVHDLKNAAASLNLMLKNLPVHFDNPAFREDALRAIGNSARRIDEMIGRLSALRRQLRLTAVETDLNQLVNRVLDTLDGMSQVDVIRELQPVPAVLADQEQIRSVVVNLILNARDALGPGGWIRIRTEPSGGKVVLTVSDNGCGMSGAFLKDSLFRPFQSTKKNGLGIGMFQSRMIVEAHGGSIRAESETGKGSTFWMSLPVAGKIEGAK